MRVFFSSISSPTFVVLSFLWCCSDRCEVTVWVCIPLIISGVEHFFIFLLAICVSSLEKCVFRSSTLKKIKFGFFDVELYGFYIYYFIGYILYKHLLIFLYLFMISFAVQNSLVWCSPIFFIFAFSHLRKHIQKILLRICQNAYCFLPGVLWIQVLYLNI